MNQNPEEWFFSLIFIWGMSLGEESNPESDKRVRSGIQSKKNKLENLN